MKLKAIIFGIAATSILSAPVMASIGNSAQGLPVLETGISSTQILANGQPERFQINIDQTSTLRVASEHFPSISSQGNHITATLYDDAGRRVAKASSPRGHFQLQRQLQPGNYELEVAGTSMGGNAEALSNRYKLHVAY